MKLWRARLVLAVDDTANWKLFFKFELQGGNYEKGSDHYWRLGDKWVDRSVPVNMKVSHHYSTYIVEQGFERELSESELQKLQENMKAFLIGKLNFDKECYLAAYQSKLKALKD